MNGLTAANVEQVISELKDLADTFEKAHAFGMAANVLGLINEIEKMQRDNTTQPSRPDRVGDECWYAATSSTYRKGVLRAWFEDFAIVEDCETNRATQTHDVYFSTEAPV